MAKDVHGAPKEPEVVISLKRQVSSQMFIPVPHRWNEMQKGNVFLGKAQ
jgi:hypothetical protein